MRFYGFASGQFSFQCRRIKLALYMFTLMPMVVEDVVVVEFNVHPAVSDFEVMPFKIMHFLYFPRL